MIRLDDILDKVREYNPKANLELINRAYVYSAKAHAGHVRQSGEPYLIHPLQVAGILSDMKMDVTTIAVGLLHDTIEDTEVTREDLLKDIDEIKGIAKRVGFAECEEVPINPKLWESTYMFDFKVKK